MRRFLPLLLLLLIPMQGQENDIFDVRVVEFTQTFNKWLLEYRGCSTHPVTNASGIPQDCTQGKEFDLKAWRKAGKLAHTLWPEP